MNKALLEEHFDANCRRYLSEWQTLLTFPSISTDPAHDGDCTECAAWLAAHLRAAGLHAELLETPTKPVVFAAKPGKPGKPVVLLYGHYDVQPVDPLDAWQTPPFDPKLRDGRLYARGAEDNKGQFFYALKAIELLLELNRLECGIKIVLEGEEESGSGGISAMLSSWQERLAADVLMVTDTNRDASGAPAIIMGLRGIVHLTVTLSGPLHDLHSGVHGGLAPNPAREMAALIASLHGADGGIAVRGFLQGILDPSAKERELLAAADFDASRYQRETGVPPSAGETRFLPTERVGFRPSIDVNGIHAGYGGKGAKTIIPSRATAKLTARLVPSQDPTACLEAIIRHLEQNAPEGLDLAIDESGVHGPGFRLDPGSALVAQARNVLEAAAGRPATLLWSGASIPVISALSAISGAEPLLAGFADEEDLAHAPNESFSIEQFKTGFLYVAMMLSALSETPRETGRSG